MRGEIAATDDDRWCTVEGKCYLMNDVIAEPRRSGCRWCSAPGAEAGQRTGTCWCPRRGDRRRTAAAAAAAAAIKMQNERGLKIAHTAFREQTRQLASSLSVDVVPD